MGTRMRPAHAFQCVCVCVGRGGGFSNNKFYFEEGGKLTPKIQITGAQKVVSIHISRQGL